MTDNTNNNPVRIFFYQGNRIDNDRKHSLIDLAYATARDYGGFPKAILIRADIHNTTGVAGKYFPDPKGWHGTFAFKGEHQVERNYHVASHGYTNGKEDFVLKEATHTREKPDHVCRGPPGAEKVVWPAEEDLLEYELSPMDFSV